MITCFCYIFLILIVFILFFSPTILFQPFSLYYCAMKNISLLTLYIISTPNKWKSLSSAIPFQNELANKTNYKQVKSLVYLKYFSNWDLMNNRSYTAITRYRLFISILKLKYTIRQIYTNRWFWCIDHQFKIFSGKIVATQISKA